MRLGFRDAGPFLKGHFNKVGGSSGAIRRWEAAWSGSV